MILYVICQFVCVIDPWAHTSFVYSILSLKLGVTDHDVEFIMDLLPGTGPIAKRPYRMSVDVHRILQIPIYQFASEITVLFILFLSLLVYS